MDETLAPLKSEEDPVTNSSYPKGQRAAVPNDTHLKTYTAGEDGSRLAEMAKQFGLENSRRPRKQVRDENAHRRGGSFLLSGDLVMNAIGPTGQKVVNLVLRDSSVEVARMRAVYSLGYYPRRADSFSDYGLVDAGLLTETERLHRRQSSAMPEWLEEIEQEEEDLHAHGVGGDLTSAVLGIVKGMVGPAILYLPHGLAVTGWALAFPMMATTTLMFLYSSRCLLDAWRLEHDRMHRVMKKEETITATAENENQPLLMASIEEGEETTTAKPQEQRAYKMTFLSYPELAYRALGERGERVIKIGIALMQSGVCLTYLIFVPQNFSTALHRLTGLVIPPEYFLLVMIGFQVPLSWIRDIRKLTITNFLANALILYGLITCLVLSLKQAMSSEDENGVSAAALEVGPIGLLFDRLTHLRPFASDWFLFIGTSVSLSL
jgi:hypothetical protein